MSRYAEQRAQTWMLQVRGKGTDTAWSPTSIRWFHSKSAVETYIANDIDPLSFLHYEYRPCRYIPAHMRREQP